jgi:hypothetical protein
MVKPIDFPDDPRLEHRFGSLNGVQYHFLYAEPPNKKWKETVFLVSLDCSFSARLY